MRLMIKEKVFSWTDTFTVTDEAGNDRYYVSGELFSFGKKLHVTDTEGREVAYVEQHIWSFLPRYRVLVNGEQIAEVVRAFSFFTPRYTVNGPGWEAVGDFWQHAYTVHRYGIPVVSIQKEWCTWGDSYVLNYDRPEDEVTALALVLAIDCAVEAQD